MRLVGIHHVLENGVQELIGQEVRLGDERTENVHHEVLHLPRVFVINYFEHQGEQLHVDLVAALDVKTHVETLDVGEVLQQVEVSFKCRVLGVLQSDQLSGKEEEDRLDLGRVFVWSFRCEDSEDVRDAASNKQLNVSALVVEEELVRQLDGEGRVLRVGGLLVSLNNSCSSQ